MQLLSAVIALLAEYFKGIFHPQKKLLLFCQVKSSYFVLGYNKFRIYLEPIQISKCLCFLHKDFSTNCKVTLAPPNLDELN